jgi:hypothetical protein
MSEPLTCQLRFQSRETPVRRGEPVTVGLPWPKGAVTDDRQFQLLGPDGTPRVLQTQVLDRWPDGSVRWCLFDFLATVDGETSVKGYRVIADSSERIKHPPIQMYDHLTLHLVAEYDSKTEVAMIGKHHVIDVGPVRARSFFQIKNLGLCRGYGYVDEFANNQSIRVQFTVANHQPAEHPNGNWDLGCNGRFNFSRLRFLYPLTTDSLTGRRSIGRGESFEVFTHSCEVEQHSSGGENWKSSNHIADNRNVPIEKNGFTMRIGLPDGTPIDVSKAERATPILVYGSGDHSFGVTIPHFWENFPKSIKADKDGITLDLFPAETELQGGEQKTHTFYVAFDKDDITDEPMVWCRSPLVCHADPEWYAASGAIPYLTPKASDPNDTYLSLVDQAIEGPDTFVHKREKIDEYGWRHFGDIYGDHEAVKHTGPTPLISHYNNQYDCVQGFLAQFLRSGDRRWLDQGLQCADHTCDIDIYHTTQDKPAYNGGLFWHTYHYVDADTGTHRSYPKSLRKGPNVNQTERVEQLDKTADKLQKAYAVGGGPSASHNYNLGLMTAYFLTGNPQYRDTAIDLARFVIRMEDPAGTPFRFLSREYTGLATDSGGGGYHGPGRASANSILALVVGHRLTGEKEMLDKAEQLIKRVCHPNQNLEKLDLLNAELRWFYTMHLQALGVYLDHKIDLGQLDEMYAYARQTLLHYARWMAVNERPILDTPEKLQFPTETWCAQDMRKVEVFQFAAKHAAGVEKEKFLERAEWFFRYVERTLPTFPTKSLCRPVVLMMKYGWSRNWWMKNPEASAPEPTVQIKNWGEWRMFVPQRAIAVRRAKRIVLAGVGAGLMLVIALLRWLFS